MIRVYRVAESIYMVRVVDRSTRFFEGFWEIPEGVTYNAYLLLGEERRVLLDTVKRPFAADFLDALRTIIEPRDIDLILVHHSEPDHSGAFPLVYEAAGRPEVVAHPIARSIIESRYGVRIERFTPARDGLKINLGGGDELVVAQTPWLHWPDTLMSLHTGTGTLFSGDAFGSYGAVIEASDAMLETAEWDAYKRLMVKYFVTVIGAYRGWVTKGLDKLSALGWKPSRIAPLHGLLIEKRIGEVLELYAALGRGEHEEKKATVIYTTMYGAVEEAALEAAAVLLEKGYRVSIHGSNDEIRLSYADAVADAAVSELLVLGVPVYEADIHPAARLLVDLLCEKAATGQKLVLIVSYGWGSVAKKLAEKLGKCGMRVEAVVEARGRLEAEKLRGAIAKVAGSEE